MDTKSDLNEFINLLKEIIVKEGSSNALEHLNTASSGDQGFHIFAQGIRTCLEAYKIMEAERVNNAFRELTRQGINVPTAFLSERMGIDLNNCLVNYAPSRGRLGDLLGQIRTLLAISITRKINIFTSLPKDIFNSGSCQIGKTILFDSYRPFTYELNHANLKEFASRDSASRLTQDCCWLLRHAPNELFANFRKPKKTHHNEKYTVVHLRAGDVLYKPNIFYLQPPLSYYRKALKAVQTKKIIVVAEEDDKGRPNPLTNHVEEFCDNAKLDVDKSNGILIEDIRLIFNASHVICGTSSFASELANASANCKYITLPHEKSNPDLTLLKKYRVCTKMPEYDFIHDWSYPSKEKWENPDERKAWIINN